jgi:hypothetical protein
MSRRRNIYDRATNTKQRDGKRQDLKDTNPLVRSGMDIINPALGNSASILTSEPQQPEIVRIRAYNFTIKQILRAQEMSGLS